MLQSRDLIAQAVVGQGAEIVPVGVPLPAVFQHIEGLLEAVKADILVGGLLVAVLPGRLLIGLLPAGVPASKGTVAPEGIPIAAGALTALRAVAALRTVAGLAGILLRIFDLVVGLVDLLHLFGRFLISRIQIRVIFFCQAAVGLLDLLVGSPSLQAQNFVRIVDHWFRSFRYFSR